MTTVEAPINDEDPSASVSPAERDFSQSPAWKNGKQQLYPEANHERSAVVLALFGPTVGPCVGDFATTYNRVNGRLYASTKAILFYSNLFGFERRLCLQLSDVEGIESYRSTSIRISMVDCEDRVFKKFPSRDVVLGVLKELLWKYSGGRIAQESNRLLPLSTNILSEDDRSDDDEESEPLRPHLSSDPEVSEQLSHLSTRRPRSQSVPHLRSPLSSQDSKPPPPPPPRAQSIISIENKPDEQTEHPTPVDYVPSEHRKILLGEISTGPTANFDIEKAWNKAKQHFDDFALEETILSCSSLDTFIDLFFADEASYTISKYQKEIVGDKEVHFSKWKRKNPSFPLIFHRNISFIHPLKNTVGPSQAKTSRKQQFQLFGNFGMTLQNLTIVEGIPAADCFQVEDRWTIETLALPGGQWALKIAVSFQICFVKRTIFKAIIQKNIRQETKTWFQGYASMVQRALTEGVVTPEPLFSIAPVKSDALETHTNVLVENPSSTSPLELVPKVVTIILVSVLVLQLFHVQRSVASLNHQMEQMKTQNLELTTALKELVSKQCIVDLK